jgi:hypothetical protein
MKKNLHAILVSITARTIAVVIRAASTTAAETPTKMFFVVGDLQYQSTDSYISK